MTGLQTPLKLATPR